MSILRLVRNFALLAVLALAAHTAAARSHTNHSHLCGAQCNFLLRCSGDCKCSSTFIGSCVPRKSVLPQVSLDTGKTQLGTASIPGPR